ncbi:MAG: tRNA (guanosine(37)-N1)-methyltransferase TrmD [Phycisphaerae bacterium]|nr:tRNA (guanosine(37)-N1)-methyltransferase TrmD [Phycisphaerae bacterium]
MPLRVDILTLFRELFVPFCETSIVGRAQQKGLADIHLTDIRDFAKDNYGTVDDAPFGGGPGMVLMCQPIFDAVEHVQPQAEPAGKVILLTPQGETFNQRIAHELAGEPRLIFLAGHYEGFDERIRTHLVDREISLGDFVLSGGEFAAMAVIDAVIRLLPGALGKDESTTEESFQQGLLEYPQYTRPREFRGLGVPEILLSGDHGKIARWRKEQAEMRTQLRRPDLWEQYRNEKTTKNDTEAGE